MSVMVRSFVIRQMCTMRIIVFVVDRFHYKIVARHGAAFRS